MSARARIEKGGRAVSGGSGPELAGSEPDERFAGGERGEPAGRAPRGAGEPLRAAARGPAGELSSELVDGAVNRARVRAVVGGLSDGGRLSDEVIDELLAGARAEGGSVGAGGPL